MPSNFKNAKIYCIKSYNTDKIYIGSTCRSLSQRFSEHKSHYKSGKLKSNSKYIFDYDNAYIELIKETPCNNLMELRKYEHYYIRKMECVNKNIPGRTRKQYKIDNEDKIKQYQKQYGIHFGNIIKNYE